MKIHQAKKYFKTASRAGFTLIELLVVVLIIGVLAAIALPQYQVAVDKSRYAQIITTVEKAKGALELYYLANGEYPQGGNGWESLDFSFPGCTGGAGGSDLTCKGFFVDMYAGANQNLMGVWGKRNPDSTLAGDGIMVYVAWLDHSSTNPGLRSCTYGDARGARVCQSMCGAKTCNLQ